MSKEVLYSKTYQHLTLNELSVLTVSNSIKTVTEVEKIKQKSTLIELLATNNADFNKVAGADRVYYFQKAEDSGKTRITIKNPSGTDVENYIVKVASIGNQNLIADYVSNTDKDDLADKLKDFLSKQPKKNMINFKINLKYDPEVGMEQGQQLGIWNDQVGRH